MSEDKKSLIDLVPDSVDNAIKNITDKPTQNIGTTLADIWYLVFGGISQAAEKRKLKYSYALQEFENELQEEISKISKEHRLEADLQIVAPALESAKYCVEKEQLRKMFVKLISSSVDEDFYRFVHPIFPTILQHFSVFDSKVFKMIYTNNTKYFMQMIEENINTLSVFINQLSTSLTIMRNNGLIFGTRQYDEYSTKTFDTFNPHTLYFIISDTLFYANKDIQNKIHKWNSLFENTLSIHTHLSSEDENLYFVQITPLGENLGKCCCT